MKKNMGTIDRIIRMVIVVLGIVAVAFLLTSLVSWCPIYRLFGLSTRK